MCLEVGSYKGLLSFGMVSLEGAMKKLDIWLLRRAFWQLWVGYWGPYWVSTLVGASPWLGDMACSERKERGRGLPESCWAISAWAKPPLIYALSREVDKYNQKQISLALELRNIRCLFRGRGGLGVFFFCVRQEELIHLCQILSRPYLRNVLPQT